MKRLAILLGVGACVGTPPGGGDDGAGDDTAAPDGGAPAVDPCATPLVVPTGGRPVDVMAPARLAEIAARLPCVDVGRVRDAIESADTIWYDKGSLVPGYQDSFGDNEVLPIGMRPNTIDPQMIDLAVPGGHAQVFSEVGVFHFPFGRPIGPAEDVVVVDFWQPPRAGGALLPVVWWRRAANTYTHRVEWMFPAGTLFGEVLFVDAEGTLYPFEIRTRTRTLDGWSVDVYRPFPRATDLAEAIRGQDGWENDPALTALVAHLDDPTTLEPVRVGGAHFGDAFPPRDGWQDVLPETDAARELLMTTAFRSARGVPWKQDGGRVAWAAGGGAIVPAGFNGGAIEVSEGSCDVCHRDAGRPFETWYPNIIAYGELWGGDEIFTWHPFREGAFVDESGDVVDFNYDNREIREDFAAAGLVAAYQEGAHGADVYRRIVREWTDWEY
jgi:hypothetical protein